MKIVISTFISLLSFGVLAIDGKKQQSVSLYLQSVPLIEALESLSEQTGYLFSYSPDIIDVTRIISINVENKDFAKVMKQLLPYNIQYKIRGNHVILVQKEEDIILELISSSNLQSDNKIVVEYIEKISSRNSGIYIPERHSSINIKKSTEMNTNITISASQTESLEKETSESKIQNILESESAIKIKTETKKVLNLAKNYLASAFIGIISLTTGSGLNAQDSSGATPTRHPFIHPSGETHPIHFSFIYPLGTGGVNSAKNNYNFSLNALGGITGSVDGVEMGWLFNINTFGSKGLQFAGIFNAAGVPGAELMESNNVQIAGIFNTTRKGLSSLQMAGIFNLADMSIAQLANIANMSKTANLQISGIANAAIDSKIQIAGITNAAGETKGQAAGIVNVAKTAGLQIAGIANASGTSGIQIAGIVNLTEKADVQIGLINIADSAKFQLGLINLSKNGFIETELYYDHYTGVNASLRSGKPWLHSILTIGKSLNKDFYSTGIGLGTSLSIGKYAGLGIDAMSQSINSYHSDTIWTSNNVLQIKPYASLKIEKLSIFGGPTFNMSILRSRYSPSAGLYRDRYCKINQWWGFSAGVRYRFFN